MPQKIDNKAQSVLYIVIKKFNISKIQTNSQCARKMIIRCIVPETHLQVVGTKHRRLDVSDSSIPM